MKNNTTSTAESFESLSNDMIWQRREKTTGFIIRRSLVAGIAIGLALLGSEGITSASMIAGSEGLEALQQAETSLIHQYTFAPTATQDKEGSANLSTYGEASFADNTLSLSGGNVWTTTMTYQSSFALEFLVRPSGLTSAYGQFFSSITGNNRFYIMQDGNSFSVRIGDGGSISNLFTGIQAGSAYYIALNFNYIDPTPGTGNDAIYTVDAWVGEAGPNGPGNLSKVYSGKIFTLDDAIAAPFSNYVRMGSFVNNVANSVWTGDLDSIAWYSSPLAVTTVAAHYAAVSKRYVLAHAMGCCSPSLSLYPSSVFTDDTQGVSFWRYHVGGIPDEMVDYVGDPQGGAREEIRLAKSAGIDAFGVFNNGDILGPASSIFKQQTEGYWKAAQADGTFKVFPEIWVLNSGTMITATVNELTYLKQNYDDAWLRIDGKRVVFFAQQNGLLQTGADVEQTLATILAPLGGKDFVYVGIKDNPRDQDYDYRSPFRPASAPEAWLRSTDAVVHWTAESYGDDGKSGPAINAYAKAINKELWMKAVPAYFVLRGNFGPAAVERLGMSGYYDCWNRIIQQQPRVAYMLTWNDNSEDSGIMPDINHRQSVLELTKHFTSWYKNGTPPAVDKEQLLLFHHPQLTEQAMKLPAEAQPCVRYNTQATPPTDYIQVVAMLKSAATVNIDLENGGSYQRIASKQLPAGVNFWLIYHPLVSATNSAIKNYDDVNVPLPMFAPVYPAAQPDFFVTQLTAALKPREIFVGVERNGERIGYFRSHEPVVGAAGKADLSTIGNVFVLDNQP